MGNPARTHTQRSANTSKAADAVFVMLMHSLLTLHLPACNETGIHVSDLLRFPFSLLSLLGMDRFFVRLLENYRLKLIFIILYLLENRFD